jgi:hypothetical protein
MAWPTRKLVSYVAFDFILTNSYSGSYEMNCVCVKFKVLMVVKMLMDKKHYVKQYVIKLFHFPHKCVLTAINITAML